MRPTRQLHRVAPCRHHCSRRNRRSRSSRDHNRNRLLNKAVPNSGRSDGHRNGTSELTLILYRAMRKPPSQMPPPSSTPQSVPLQGRASCLRRCRRPRRHCRAFRRRTAHCRVCRRKTNCSRANRYSGRRTRANRSIGANLRHRRLAARNGRLGGRQSGGSELLVRLVKLTERQHALALRARGLMTSSSRSA